VRWQHLPNGDIDSPAPGTPGDASDVQLGAAHLTGHSHPETFHIGWLSEGRRWPHAGCALIIDPRKPEEVVMTALDQPLASRIVLDVPAANPTLRFDQIAGALSTIVESSQPRFAVGIFGGWGSGKSTLMNEIQRRLVSRDIIVVEFNAWRYEREPHLIVPLLDTIRAGLAAWADRAEATDANAEKIRDIARRVGRVVRALVRSASVDIGIPGAVSISVDPGKALDEITAPATDPATSPQSLYFGAFEELTSAFAGVHGAGIDRIVVMVDDLDRCLPQQALTVLESMKLFFDMPGFVFVVGLDEHVVESAVRTKFVLSTATSNGSSDAQLERDYLKKIFQVPYTLPALVPDQLDDLLQWLYQHAELPPTQQNDLRLRVSRYLGYVAQDGRLNPREVKRFINAYTLSRMIRPDLDADTLLALQTLDFRVDWEGLYDGVVLAEPEIFSAALRIFRTGDDHAFEDLWPEVGVLPRELASFLRSPEAMALERPDLGNYVTFLETTRSAQSWVTDAMRDVGSLRAQLRAVVPDVQPGSAEARNIATSMTDALARLSSYHEAVTGLSAPLERLRTLAAELTPSVMPGSVAADASWSTAQADQWRNDAAAQADSIQQELRLVRRAKRFAA
jgi:hypothetical protein